MTDTTPTPLPPYGSPDTAPYASADAPSYASPYAPAYAPLMRRLSAAFYEAALVFGIYFVPAYLYLSITRTTFEIMAQGGPRLWGFQAFIFLVFAVYFGWSWSQGRRTLPQKTWGLRVLMQNGAPLTQTRAVLRYTLAWASLIFGLLGFFYALVDKERAFLHDRLLGTRIYLDETGAAYGANPNSLPSSQTITQSITQPSLQSNPHSISQASSATSATISTKE